MQMEKRNSKNSYFKVAYLYCLYCIFDSDVVIQSCTENSELLLPARNLHEMLPVGSQQCRPLLPSAKQSCLLHPLRFYISTSRQRQKKGDFNMFMQNCFVSSLNQRHSLLNVVFHFQTYNY